MLAANIPLKGCRVLILSSSEERQWEELFHQDKDIRELSWHAEGMILFPMFSLF